MVRTAESVAVAFALLGAFTGFASAQSAAVPTAVRVTDPRQAPNPGGIPDALTGTWEGVVTGRDMTTANSILSDPARLTIEPDGRFTLVEGGNAKMTSRGVARVVGDDVILEGTVSEPESRRGERVVHRLKLHNGGLFGRVTSTFLGNRITPGADLHRAPAG